jgi:hypothetical protein
MSFTIGTCRTYNLVARDALSHRNYYSNTALQVLQFLEHAFYIRDLPSDVIEERLMESNEENFDNLLAAFHESNLLFIEISSLKDKVDSQGVSHGVWSFVNSNDTFTCLKATFEELTETLEKIVEILKLYKPDAKVVFQCHFRPQIISPENGVVIPNRELIHDALSSFVQKLEDPSVAFVDPSKAIELDEEAYVHEDDNFTHFTDKGVVIYHHYIEQLIPTLF